MRWEVLLCPDGVGAFTGKEFQLLLCSDQLHSHQHATWAALQCFQGHARC